MRVAWVGDPISKSLEDLLFSLGIAAIHLVSKDAALQKE